MPSNAGFFKLKSLAEARAICDDAYSELRTEVETCSIDDALGRVLAEPVSSLGPVPHFTRSVVDGYAVSSADTSGATAGSPAYLECVGEVLMGEPTDIELSSGQCAVIPTGGMLPRGGDAVVMIEHTERLGATTVEIGRAVAAGAHVIGVGDDVAPGVTCLERGRCLGAGDLAMLATLGVTEVAVHRRPVVAILSTGDEVVPPTVTPGPAQVRDANAIGLAALVRRAGGLPRIDGIVKDTLGSLAETASRSLETADVLMISGGSSVGERDHARAVLDSLGDPGVLLHGLAIKPGKPTIAALAGRKPVFGLPGHPLSAMVSFHVLLRPILRRLAGEVELWEPRTTATLRRKVPSDSGRAEFVRVDLTEDADGQLWAEPLFGKSAALSSLITAKGLVEVPVGIEGFDAGAVVRVEGL
jgi:molybdopterin molybdotransferase